MSGCQARGGAGARHPAGAQAKLRAAQVVAGRIPATAYVYSYGPTADCLARYELAAATGLPLWINRYEYSS